MNHICTWFCADEPGEESLFPQTGKRSSSQSHQDIYWRCIVVFFITSRRFNPNEKHVLFTNVHHLPIVDGRKMGVVLEALGVEVVHTDFKYKTPKGYFGMFQNQFYEFSILEHIAGSSASDQDLYLVLDSDCIFLKPAAQLFERAEADGFLSFEDDVQPDYVINGLSRRDMKAVFEAIEKEVVPEMPSYHLGEFLLCSVANIKKIFGDFTRLWPVLLERHAQGLSKFNEEAHTLSYLYWRNGLQPSNDPALMRRIWTNPLFYREVRASDIDLVVWHLPAEKTFGIERLYDHLMNRVNRFGFDMSAERYLSLVKKTMNVPDLPVNRKIGYYVAGYYRALSKRLRRLLPSPPAKLQRQSA